MDYKEHFHSLIDEGNFEEAFAYLKKRLLSGASKNPAAYGSFISMNKL